MKSAPNSHTTYDESLVLEAIEHLQDNGMPQRSAAVRAMSSRVELLEAITRTCCNRQSLPSETGTPTGMSMDMRDAVIEECALAARNPDLFKHYTDGPMSLCLGVVQAIRALKNAAPQGAKSQGGGDGLARPDADGSYTAPESSPAAAAPMLARHCTIRCYEVAEKERCDDCPSRLSQAASVATAPKGNEVRNPACLEEGFCPLNASCGFSGCPGKNRQFQRNAP